MKDRIISNQDFQEKGKKAKPLEYPTSPRTQQLLDYLRENKKKAFTLYKLHRVMAGQPSHVHEKLKILCDDGYVKVFACPTCEYNNSKLYQAI